MFYDKKTKYLWIGVMSCGLIMIIVSFMPTQKSDTIESENRAIGECWEPGCHEKALNNSAYCQKHRELYMQEKEREQATNASGSYSASESTKKPYSSYSGSSSSKSYSSYSSNSSSKSGETSKSSRYSKSKKSYSNPYESYDKGYEDVTEDGDYDDDRYNRDDDYAEGVDDAIDEDEEGDW